MKRQRHPNWKTTWRSIRWEMWPGVVVVFKKTGRVPGEGK